MKKKKQPIQWSGIIKLILIGVVAGLINIALTTYVVTPMLGEVTHDEVVVSTYAINLFVGWVFFSAWFLAKADEEWKKVSEAVVRNNREEFMIEAPKRIATSIRVLYVLISLLVVLSFHLFHAENPFVFFEIQFGIGFLVMVTILVLWDLDDPVTGVINVPNIPQEWLQELAVRDSLESEAIS